MNLSLNLRGGAGQVRFIFIGGLDLRPGGAFLFGPPEGIQVVV
jgi:hypothetical protein